MTDKVLIDVTDAVCTITLNDPDQRNPITDVDLLDGVLGALGAAEEDPDVRAIVLTGAGSAFSSGGNVKKMLGGGGMADPDPTATRGNYKAGIQRLPLVLDALETPTIAAVNGAAVGAGCDLTLMCDIRIAGESARFAESFVKLGIVPGDGGAWLLQRVVGYSKAAEMALTGDMLTAAEALECGLVSRVVPDAELLSAAHALAARIAANPPQAVRMAKRLLKQGREASLADHLEMAAAMQALAHTTDDHVEAVTAFIEKRPPVFKG
ncbi:crotonase/enoyl-CoA hydratase family protein [Chachezhania antarctica]|uniref:crotonase/enoyl-CoA hydratase family protein n=1 Tax=Chachezhania antarctica TaxID=2340860 RepID=UPI000EADF9E2|nr:crotonase/enoyl-CoA hydratase family protein [Chachezhania antarctica]|tara:strand:+ start:355 stop:1152 length:798 start_codon:yes stop_codon:yes gene_type:complete